MERAYFEGIDDRFFKVRILLQKYDLKRLTKEELIVEIKKKQSINVRNTNVFYLVTFNVIHSYTKCISKERGIYNVI